MARSPELGPIESGLRVMVDDTTVVVTADGEYPGEREIVACASIKDSSIPQRGVTFFGGVPRWMQASICRAIEKYLEQPANDQ